MYIKKIKTPPADFHTAHKNPLKSRKSFIKKEKAEVAVSWFQPHL